MAIHGKPVANAVAYVSQTVGMVRTYWRRPRPGEYVCYREIALPGIRKPQGQRLDLSKYELTFEDHFDGDAPDPSRWNLSDGVRKGGFWHPSAVRVADSELVIRTERREGVYGDGYYSAELTTKGKFSQTYGYFECRCILPAARGLWSAFWMMPCNSLDRGRSGREGMEIDIFESPFFKFKRRNLVTSNLHYGGYSVGHRLHTVGFFAADEPYSTFHTYGVEWTPRAYIFYIDGIESGRSSFGGVSQVPEYLLLSVETDGFDGKPFGGWSGNIKKNPPGTLPQDFRVDYVRAYSSGW